MSLLDAKQVERPPDFDAESSKSSEAHFAALTESHTPPENSEAFMFFIESISRCLLDDTEMKSLLSAAINKIAAIRLKINLAILLEDFAQRLTTDRKMEAIGHFVSPLPFLFRSTANPFNRWDREL